MRATASQNLTTSFGSHASTKAMTAFAHDFAWLIGALHGLNLQPKTRKEWGFYAQNYFMSMRKDAIRYCFHITNRLTGWSLIGIDRTIAKNGL